jgi:hypothetical protein
MNAFRFGPYCWAACASLGYSTDIFFPHAGHFFSSFAYAVTFYAMGGISMT